MVTKDFGFLIIIVNTVIVNNSSCISTVKSNFLHLFINVGILWQSLQAQAHLYGICHYNRITYQDTYNLPQLWCIHHQFQFHNLIPFPSSILFCCSQASISNHYNINSEQQYVLHFIITVTQNNRIIRRHN